MFFEKAITLNIESTELRFLVAHGKRVDRWGSVSLEPGLVKEGLIVDPPAVSRAISELLAEQQVNGRDLVASLNGFQSVQRLLDLPKLPPKLLEDALMREAKRTMPVPLEQLYLSWQEVGSDGETQRVLVLGTPRNLIDAEVQCFRHSGFTPRLMDLKPLALARMVNHAEALIIDVEAESADIIVVSDGIPVIMRTITMRSDYSLTRRIQYLVDEFERTLQFYDSSHAEEPLSRATPLFLTGGLVSDNEVHRAVAAGVDYQVESLASPLECPPHLPLTQYAVNMGLALKTLAASESQSRADINILPEIYRPRGLPVNHLFLAAGILAGIAIVFPLYQMANSATNDVYHAQTELDTINHQLQLRQMENQQAKQIEDSIARVQQNTQNLQTELQGFGYNPPAAYDTLRLIAVESLPAEASLLSASMESGQLLLRGEATSYEVALEYAYTLRQTEEFSSLWINSLNADEEGKVSFDFILKER